MNYRIMREEKKIKYEITQVEKQLESVEKRIRMVRFDFICYVLFLAVPPVVIKILEKLADIRHLSQANTANVVPLVLTRGIFSIAHDVLFVIYIILVPAFLYHLVKSAWILYFNHQDETSFTEPDVKRFSYYKTRKQERSYTAERNKLIWILSRYSIYEEKIAALEKALSENPSALSEEEIEKQLSGLVYYEEIPPTDGYGSVAARAKKGALWVMFVSIVGIAVWVIITFLY